MVDLENSNIYKLNKYFYMDKDENILKYKRYCIIADCEKNSSFNYKDQKDPIYGFLKHFDTKIIYMSIPQ